MGLTDAGLFFVAVAHVHAVAVITGGRIELTGVTDETVLPLLVIACQLGEAHALESNGSLFFLAERMATPEIRSVFVNGVVQTCRNHSALVFLNELLPFLIPPGRCPGSALSEMWQHSTVIGLTYFWQCCHFC